MKNLIIATLFLCAFQVSNAYACTGDITDELLCETPEILFETGEAAILQEKAMELGSVVNIYEYLKNNAKYAVYHGARSSSLNTFAGLEGNDVDLASTLIALYRSVGVKARYAVGNVRLKRSDVANWVGVTNTSLAVSILQDQGITIVDDTDVVYVIIEHVWVEALVNFANYRGASEAIAECTSASDQCKWVALDPSFKLRTYKPEYKDLLAGLAFDYDAYYHAESDQNLRDKSPLEIFEESALEFLRSNNPGVTLEDVIDSGKIIEETLGLLPSSLPYTVIGNVQRYNSVQLHDQSADEIDDWENFARVNIYLDWAHDTTGVTGTGCDAFPVGKANISLVELSTKQLTVNWFQSGSDDGLVVRLGGNILPTGLNPGPGDDDINCGGETIGITKGIRFSISVDVDASAVEPVTVVYDNLIVGGYYLVATGGETSNWSQVRRAYRNLLAANEQYPLINNASGEDVYIDSNGNGSVDQGETRLLDNQEAQDALTGGLLYTAQAHYYTRLKEESRRYSRLKNIVTPIAAFVGVVSTTLEVELIEETPFAVLPGGLLIDLKGIRINGSWEADEAETYSNEAFKFIGHVASSLEHEVWQELTGYDAVSTMRGIQFALRDGATLLDIHSTTAENLESANISSAPDTVEASLLAMGFSNTPPSGYVRYDYPDVFGRQMVAWDYSGSPTQGMYILKGDVQGIASDDPRAGIFTNSVDSENEPTTTNSKSSLDFVDTEENRLRKILPVLKTREFTVSFPSGTTIVNAIVANSSGEYTVDEYFQIYDDTWRFVIRELENNGDDLVDFQLRAYTSATQYYYVDSAFDSSDTASISCNGSNFSGPAQSALDFLEDCFEGWSGARFLDINEGYDPDTYFYKSIDDSVNLGTTEHTIQTVETIRGNVYFTNTEYWRNYTIPSEITHGPYFAFNVYIADVYREGGGELVEDYDEVTGLVRSSYIIENQSFRAGGGYVPEGVPVDPATDTEGVEGSGGSLDTSGVTFNNEVFTDLNLVAIANNDVIRTPSTVDPVSTVTGNMYHDETDIVIAGKGLPYTFTRTYNSNETSTDGPDSANPSYLPLSQGWTHSYNMKLVANDYGQYPNYDSTLAPENDNNSTSSFTYMDERGGESNYLLVDATTSSQPTSPRAGFDDLVLNSPSSGLHTISYNNGVKYTFDSQGANMRTPGTVARLYRIEDAYGNQLNFAYTSGRLTAITDNLGLSGRTGLTLEYYTSGSEAYLLRYVRDWTGRQWEYRYTGRQLSSVVNPLGDAMAYTYVAGTHWLKDIIHPQDRNGKQKTMTFSYYENGQAYNYVDQNGSAESLIYDLFRRRTRVTNPRGLITEHYYDENGALIKLVEPDKGILLFDNNQDGLRYRKYNALGQSTSYSYSTSRALDGAASDTNGQVTREQDALGYTVDYDYGIHGQVTTVKDKNGNNFTNVYYTSSNTSTGAVIGKLFQKVAASATVNGVVHTNVILAEYRYYPDGTVSQVTEFIDPAQPSRSRVTNYTYTYNSDGSYTLLSTVSGSGTTVTNEKVYDALWRLQASTVYRRTSPTNATLIALTSTHEYDDLGRLVRTTDPLGNIAETVFDANGQVSQAIVRYKLQAANNSPLHPECMVDLGFPNHYTCITVTNTYDAADRLLTSTNIKGATTHYHYNPMGNVTKVTNDLGNSLLYEYDARGRRTMATDEKGYSVKTAYDLAGRVTSITDANNSSVNYTYDALGRQLTVTSPEGRITRYDQYDANGNVIRLTDPNGVAGVQPLNSQNASVSNVFDEFNRIASTLNAKNEQTQYTYDLLGNRTSVTDAKNQTTNFVYDDLGRLTTVIDPIVESGSDKVVSITYDELGNRLTYTDRLSEVTEYTYDNLNRLLQENYLADGITAEKVYDQYGDMVSTSYGGNTYIYTYDVAHRLLSKTDTRNNRSMSWVYDSVGNLIRKTNYEGDLYTYTYDSGNRLVAMAIGEDPLMLHASYHYDPAGRLLSRILSNGAATLYNYTTDGFVTSIKQIGADGNQLDLREYGHDQVGNITRLTVNGETTYYAYDPAYRLTSVYQLYADCASGPCGPVKWHGVLGYAYDSVGNREMFQDYQTEETWHYIVGNGNRLNEVRSDSVTGPLVYSFNYDANGSMTAKFNGSGQALLNIDYDQRRLASVMAVDNVPNSMAFEYDANAYRIEKQNSAGTKKYYLEAEHLESVYDGDDELQANYLRGSVVDEIINGFEKNAATGQMENRTFHHDQVNSVVAVTDHNGQAVQTTSYGPFGEALGATGSSQNTMQYTGREQDAESGLYYYRARYYDAELGRFISEDPLGFEAGINFYAYVGNNPLIFNDPEGEVPHIVIGAGIGALLSVGAQGLGDLARREFRGYSAYAGAAVSGGLAGGLIAATGGASLLVTAGASSLGAVSGTFVTEGLNAIDGALTGGDYNFNGYEFSSDLVIAAGGGLLFGAAGKYADNFLPSTASLAGAISRYNAATFGGATSITSNALAPLTYRTTAQQLTSEAAGFGFGTADNLTGEFLDSVFDFGASASSTASPGGYDFNFNDSDWDVQGWDFGASSAGGFVLYPNKLNNNYINVEVYRK